MEYGICVHYLLFRRKKWNMVYAFTTYSLGEKNAFRNLARAHIASLAVSGRCGIKSDVRAKVSVLLTVSTYAVAGANPIAVISPVM